jgi:hypothetical protein
MNTKTARHIRKYATATLHTVAMPFKTYYRALKKHYLTLPWHKRVEFKKATKV